jgi:hypothetical protein
MNWNRIEFHYGQQLELRTFDGQALRWVPVSVCGVMVAHGNDPQYQVEEVSGRTHWAARQRLRTIFKNSESTLLTDRQTADSICTPDARATE